MTEILSRVQSDLVFVILISAICLFFFFRFHSFIFLRLFLFVMVLLFLFLKQPVFLLAYFAADWGLSLWILLKEKTKRRFFFKFIAFSPFLILICFFSFFSSLFSKDEVFILASAIILLFNTWNAYFLAQILVFAKEKMLFYLTFAIFTFQITLLCQFYFQAMEWIYFFHLMNQISLLGGFFLILWFLYFKIIKNQKSNEKLKQKLYFFEKEYMRIFEKSTGLYVLLDMDFNILNFNKKFVKALGTSQEEILKKNFMQFIPKVFRNKMKLLKNYLRFHNEASGEFALSNASEGGSIDVFINAIKDNNTVFMLIQDITAVKWMQNSISSYADQLKKEMEYAKVADRMKNVFLANVSHEIRTPLTSVLGFTSLLKETPLSSIQIDYLNKIENGGEMLLRILNDIIDLSKIEAGRMEVEIEKVNINKILKEIYEKLYSQIFRKSIDFKMEMSKELKENYLLLDNYRLKQVFHNLFSNAAKFTEQGFIVFRGKRENDKIIFEIEDSGIGIAKEKLGRVFEPFFQEDDNLSRKYGGTGLGLAISKSLVNLMGGEIEILSEEAKGTLVKISFPSFIMGERINNTPDILEPSFDRSQINENQVPPLMEEEKKATSKNIGDSSRTILLGEDDDSVCMLVDFVLTKNNIKILRARDGEEVMHLYHANKERLKIILLDINLPKIDGITIAQNIRKENTAIKIIGFSAYYYDEIKDRISGLMDYYIKKPFKINEFYDILQEYF